jgi:hypothetical protein
MEEALEALWKALTHRADVARRRHEKMDQELQDLTGKVEEAPGSTFEEPKPKPREDL